MMITQLLKTLLALATGHKLPNETIKIDGAPYLTRYYLTGENTRTIGEGRNLFLHHFHTSDQGRELHNHPYTGTSLILSGGYVEERMSVVDHVPMLGERSNVLMLPVYGEVTKKVFHPGTINRLGLEDFHRTELLDEVNGAWTLFLTGPRVSSWGFIDRVSKAYYPYMSKRNERLGGGPHTRGVHKAPSVGSRARVGDVETAARRSKELASLAAFHARAGAPVPGGYVGFVNASPADVLRPNDRHGLVERDKWTAARRANLLAAEPEDFSDAPTVRLPKLSVR